jgi:hypothetical protein
MSAGNADADDAVQGVHSVGITGFAAAAKPVNL